MTLNDSPLRTLLKLIGFGDDEKLIYKQIHPPYPFEIDYIVVRCTGHKYNIEHSFFP